MIGLSGRILLTTTAWDDALLMSNAGAGFITGGALAVGLGVGEADGLGDGLTTWDALGVGLGDGLAVSANVGKLGINSAPKAIREVRKNFHLVRIG